MCNDTTLTTNTIVGLTSNFAASGGNITSDGGATVTARGVCWSTSINPTIELGTKTNDGTGFGTFTSTITGLTNGETYYIRAYVTNCVGTGYGSEIQYVHIDNVGIDVNPVTDISVYPNPVKGILNIAYANDSYTFINILNSQGALLGIEQAISVGQKIDFSKYESGFYILGCLILLEKIIIIFRR
jgi:hypothetical protein